MMPGCCPADAVLQPQRHHSEQGGRLVRGHRPVRHLRRHCLSAGETTTCSQCMLAWDCCTRAVCMLATLRCMSCVGIAGLG